ncbi:MAG: hypothetical protein DCC57_25120 [Chloroflexi bacterium]|nr:MAG: hypothetical protein DCC57_25120 [Chloroflexota bacterium]
MTCDLTPRELEVLQLVAEGLNSRAIGARLFISEKTVRCHVHNLLGKLGVPNRVALVRAATRQGLLEETAIECPHGMSHDNDPALLVAIERDLGRAEVHLARCRALLASAQQADS